MEGNVRKRIEIPDDPEVERPELKRGVLEQHRDRMATDPAYRQAHLGPSANDPHEQE